MKGLFIHGSYWTENYRYYSISNGCICQHNRESRLWRLLRCGGYLSSRSKLRIHPRLVHPMFLLYMQEKNNNREQGLSEDPVSGSSIQENHCEHISDPWAVSRREAVRAFLGLVEIVLFIYLFE